MEGLREAEPALVDGLVQYWDALVEATMYEAKKQNGAQTFMLGDREITTTDKNVINAARSGDEAALNAELKKIAAKEDAKAAKAPAAPKSTKSTPAAPRVSTKKKVVGQEDDEEDVDSGKKSLRAQRAAKNNGQQYYSQNGYGLEYDKRWSSAVRNVADKRGKHKLKEHGLVELLGIPQNSTIFDKYKGRPRDLAEDVLDNSDSTRQAHGRLSFTGNVRSDAVGQLFKKAAKFVSEISAEYKSDHDPKVAKKKPKAKRVYGKQAQPKRKSTAKVVKA